MRRALVLAAVVALSVAAPARAGVVEVSDLAGAAFLHYEDSAGVPDDLRIASPDEQTITLHGATVTAGRGCVAVTGGASCALPAGSVAFDPVIATEGGDDRVVSEVADPIRIFGGAGSDQLSFTGLGKLYGMAGDDVLVANGPATLEGGAGNDHLIAQVGSELAGGKGADRLDGSPQADVLVDAGDRGSVDVITCGGGADVTQADPADRLEGCSSAALDAISKVRYFWRVFQRDGLTEPLVLRVRKANYNGLQSPFARCLGAPCRGARLRAPIRDPNSFRIVSGGVRHRYRGRARRTVRAGAIIRVGLEFESGGVRFTKGLEFRTHARRLPSHRKRCTVAIPARTGRPRPVPCT